MTEIIITRGIPASGKSTWAIEWVKEDPENRIRLNRDDLRQSFFGKRANLTARQEKFITKAMLKAARTAVRDGMDVVVDATNLQKRWLKDWYKVGATVTVRDFPISVDEAIARNEGRPHAVPEGVIRKFYGYLKGGQFPALPNSPRGDGFRKVDVEATKGKPFLILTDVDGTVAHNPGPERRGRNFYDYSRVHEDTPIRVSIHAIMSMRKTFLDIGEDVKVVAFSGRDDSCADATRAWFAKHGLCVDELYMRKTGDIREDAVVKHEMFWEHIGEEYDVLAVFDDREAVCRMWHEIGLPLLRVGDPEADF